MLWDRRSLLVWSAVVTLGVTCVLVPEAAARADAPSLEGGGSDAGTPLGLSFGLKGALGFSQHSGTEERGAEYDVASSWRNGIAVSAFLYVPVTPRFGIQQEISYVQKGSRQNIGVDILEIPTVLQVTYDMDYIEIPVLMRFTWHESRRWKFYSLAGTALSFKVRDHYVLEGEVDDGDQVVPIAADSDMSEVDLFDYSFVYGFGLESTVLGRTLVLEYRFTLGWNTLSMPTYAYIPFGDEEVLIDNDPVPLKNQNHLIMLGIAF